MSQTKFVDFRAIKSEVTMLQVLEHYGLMPQMHQNGDTITGACPIHGGTNKTAFRISISKNCWNCFSTCQGGGNVLDFVAKKEGVPVLKAANLLVEWFGLNVAKGAEKPHREPVHKVDDKERQGSGEVAQEQDTRDNKPLSFVLKNLQPDHPYLTGRGLSPETIQTFGLGFCAKGLQKNRIAIPIHNQTGQLVAYAGRAVIEGGEKYQLPKGFKKSNELFNVHRALADKTDQPLVIVEGFFDCMKLWQHGCRRVVALMGSSLSKQQEALIAATAQQWKQAVVMLDEDDAGRNARGEIACRLARFLFVKLHVFPTEGMQPDQLSAKEIRQLFGGATAKVYSGTRNGNQATVTVDGQVLNPRLDLWDHSPDGLEWGYGGSGPAQLALALLADHLRDDEDAVRLHQSFKEAVVSGLPRAGWTLTSDQIQQRLDALSHETA